MKADIEFISEGSVTSPRGFKAGATYAAINKHARYGLDVGMLASETPCTAVGVFTRNKVKGAPVLLCQSRLPSGSVRAVVVNSGCANAGTGDAGLRDALGMAAMAAHKVGVNANDVLVASTGVIGRRLPLDMLKSGISRIDLCDDGGHEMAMAIMTTDTVPKEVAVRAGECAIGGIAKGSGMIHPDMATLLCFLTTDAVLDVEFMGRALQQAVDQSFNMVSVDGDTSPNDTVLLLANGMTGGGVIKTGTLRAKLFQKALDAACLHLAKAVARDGEGATRLIQVTVSGAVSLADARACARTIVTSPLVKSAIHGSDPNWGRILAAAGRSGAELLESKLALEIGGIAVVGEGMPLPFDADQLVEVLDKPEVFIHLNLNLGEASATAWGCDLSAEYVAINSEYTT